MYNKGALVMIKEEFNNLDIMDQVEYINKMLNEKRSLTNIASDLSIGRSTIRDRFKKVNYIYDKKLNQYIKCEKLVCDTEVIQSNTNVLESINREELKKYNVSNTDVNKKILNITNEYEILMEMIELYKCNSNVLQNKIIIDLPEADSELTSFRINKEILKQFNDFVKKQKEFRKIDLVSMALKEYMENHNS